MMILRFFHHRFCLSFILLFSLTPCVASGKDPSKTYQDLNLFADILSIVDNYYVDDVGNHKLIQSAIRGMLSSLDPHTVYLPPRAFEDMRSSTKGEFGGIGIEFELKNGMVNVITPIDGTPADLIGLRPGDAISHVDDKPIKKMSLPDVVHSMRGKIGTPLRVRVHRENEEPFTVTIIRDKISVNPVKFRTEGEIGYMRLTTFSEKASSALRKAIVNLQRDIPGGPKGYILDLRNNPGGLLSQAVGVANLFLERGEIVSTRGRNKNVLSRSNATEGDILDGRPLIVLINGASASASEVVAGALQSQQRSITVGTTSYGKGSVQNILPLGSKGAIKITTALYYTASGEKIDGNGITPDIFVLQGPLDQPVSPLEEVLPKGKKQAKRIPKETEKDRLLLYALLLLKPVTDASQQ